MAAQQVMDKQMGSLGGGRKMFVSVLSWGSASISAACKKIERFIV